MNEELNYANPSPAVTTAGVEKVHELLVPLHHTQKAGIALVGLGTYSTEQLAPALLETKCCRLAGLVTGSPSKIPEWKNKYAVPDDNIYSYANFDTIAGNKDIDIVYIALPNALHAEYVIRAAEAGKHVICEKPMALTVAECDDMISACKKAGKLLSIGYRLHFDPNHAEVVRITKEKIFGELNYLRAQHGSGDTSGWRLDKSLAGGGPLMDLGIYCIQASCYTTGHEPVAVNVVESKLANDDPNEIEEYLSWEMEFPGGLVVNNETSYLSEMNMLHAKADHGWFELSPAYSYKGIAGKTATGFFNFSTVNQQALQMDDFALSVLNNKPVKLPGEMGRRDMKIIEAIYKSMRTGKRVEIATD
jgi:predicted dehydrogenase